MKVCSHGHVYDESKDSSCPYCKNGNNTIPLDTSLNFNNKNISETMPIDNGGPVGNFSPTIDPYAKDNKSSKNNTNDQMGETQYFDTEDAAELAKPTATIRETVGWLVVMSQPQRGRTYQIYPQNNHIGRGDKFVINVDFDKQISSSGDAIISYNPQNRGFSIRPIDTAKNISFVNDAELYTPCKLKDYDKIKIGATTLIFRSFCNEEHSYSDYED